MSGATVIMTETLPTVVGMATVTRVTETTLGRGGRRVGKKSKSVKRVKIYQGKRGGRYILRKGRKIYI